MSDFIALHAINAPNSYARAYNTGDPVLADVVTAWDLTIGEDVEPADGYQHPRPAEDSTDRAAWETYVVGKGTSLDDARAASLDDLRAMHDPDPEPEPPAHDLPASVSAEGVDGTGVQNPTPVGDDVPSPAEDSPRQDVAFDVPRPAESAKKADWIDYVVGMDPNAGAWARSDDTTKADLIAWKP